MKKVLVPAALLLGMAGAAQAQVTLYGLLDGSYGKSLPDDAAGLREDFHSGGDNGSSEGNSTSRFGLKGSTDVGKGVKANFKLESNGITSDGHVGGTSTVNDVDGTQRTVSNGPFFARQAWFGLSSASWGEFRLGRQDSVAFQTAVDYDFNGASNGVSALGYTGVAPWNAVSGRQSRQLNYLSPTYGGVKFQLAYVPNGNGGTGNDVDGYPDNKDTFSAAVTYATGPISATVNYETERNDQVGHDFASIVGSYDFGFAKVMLGYAAGGTGYEGISTGFVAPIAGVNVGILAGYNTDNDGYGVEFFVNKEIFKNTIAYLEATQTNSKAANPGYGFAGKATGWATGLIYLF